MNANSNIFGDMRTIRFFLSNLKLNPFFTFLMQKLAGKTVKLKKYSSAIEA